jgi:hypothetical protein
LVCVLTIAARREKGLDEMLDHPDRIEQQLEQRAPMCQW